MVRAAETVAQQRKGTEGVDAEHRAAMERARAVEDEASRAKVAIEQQYAGQQNRVQREQLIHEQDEKIKQANSTVKTIQSRIDVIDKPIKDAQDRLRDAEEKMKAFNKEIGAQADDITKQGVVNAREVAAELARRPMTKFTNVLREAIGSEPVDDIYAEQARGLAKKKIKAKGVKERQQADREILSDAGEAPAAGGGAQH
jgi:hypothetical protein